MGRLSHAGYSNLPQSDEPTEVVPRCAQAPIAAQSTPDMLSCRRPHGTNVPNAARRCERQVNHDALPEPTCRAGVRIQATPADDAARGNVRPAAMVARPACTAAEAHAAPARLEPMTSPLGLAPKVIEILVAIVTSGGEALAASLAMTCGLTKPQLTRQLNWMERQNLINQVHSRDGRTWVRATVVGRDALGHPGESS